MNQADNIIPTKDLTRADWERFSLAWEKSGLTQQDFCRKQHIGFHAFSYWRNRLSKEERAQKGKIAGFKPAHVVPDEKAMTTNHLPIVINQSNGSRVTLPSSANEATVRLVFELLGLTSC